MGLKFNPRKKTMKDFVSEEILSKFVKQLPWMKDQLFGSEWKDVVKIDQIENTEIKLKDGTMSGVLFLKILAEHPQFELGNHKYEFRLSNFFRTGLEPKKYKNHWPGFHVRKIFGQRKVVV